MQATHRSHSVAVHTPAMQATHGSHSAAVHTPATQATRGSHVAADHTPDDTLQGWWWYIHSSNCEAHYGS